MRLNKYISSSGFCSRRKADEWIAAGKVMINGKPAGMGMQVEDKDIVTIQGKVICHDEPFKLIAFYKPTGFSCTSHRGDASGIFRNFPLDADLKYVGRLDKDSEGLLLLTNDGDLCQSISKARFAHEKEYIVTVHKDVTEEFIDGMCRGVRILDPNKGQMVVTRPCKVQRITERTFSIVLTQGLNRQIRRMCEHFDYRVRRLSRVRVMNIELGDMKPGEIREVTKQELDQLKSMIKEQRQ